MLIELTAYPEDDSPEEAERQDRIPGFAEAVRNVEATATSPWGWCTAEVKVTVDGKSATNTLGQCSYKDEVDFVRNSGYFLDMVREALNKLLAERRSPLEMWGKGVVIHTPGSTIRIVDGQIQKD